MVIEDPTERSVPFVPQLVPILEEACRGESPTRGWSSVARELDSGHEPDVHAIAADLPGAMHDGFSSRVVTRR